MVNQPPRGLDIEALAKIIGFSYGSLVVLPIEGAFPRIPSLLCAPTTGRTRPEQAYSASRGALNPFPRWDIRSDM